MALDKRQEALYSPYSDPKLQASGLKRLYEDGDQRGIRPDLVDTVQEILTVLDGAKSPLALNLSGYRLHMLKGDMKGLVCNRASELAHYVSF